ncbi:MAG: inorganic phosphate transporter [Bacteroidales bacterium]|nr:inorganic phosphate transporter [Bacteroidales bacterium]MBR5781512.1 inorganic phosphate transporter [Bacteroidales bacterium]
MLVFVIAASLILALLITFLNGMNDAADAVSCLITTKVLTPFKAVAWAALWGFMAYFIFNSHVAETMSHGIVENNYIDPYVVFSALIGATSWIWICTKLGLPISSSQALIGGLIGPVWFAFGSSALVSKGILVILAFVFLTPLIGVVLGFFFMCLIMRIFKNSNKKKTDKMFKKMQLISSAAFSLGHGANDAQKTIGLISIMLFTSLQSPDITERLRNVMALFFDIDKGYHVPQIVAVLCYLVMALGTMVGGKNVIKTTGTGIVKITPEKGFCAETVGATTIITCSIFGIPVSTSHGIVGSIIGVGLTSGVKGINWGTAKSIIWAWVLTIPAPLLISGILYSIMK